MAKDINKKKFDGATKLKLEIFRECFKEWLPVFIHNPFVEKIFIYDFFAGSGIDSENNHGSPLILLDEAKGENQMFCSKVPKGRVVFGYNEKIELKRSLLESNVTNHIKKCLLNCSRTECVYNVGYGSFDFKEVFERENVSTILNNPKFGKFILLDQYGFKEVDNDVFKKLTESPRTDFIFFISSSFIRRFKEHPNVLKYFETNKINFDESKPMECHKYVANYFRTLIPKKSEFYLHQFTIKKGSNYYGLIFGTGHTLGMEKFLKVCWDKDKLSGESNFSMYNDFKPNTLFYTETNTVRINEYKAHLKKDIFSGKVKSNLEGMKHALLNGVPTRAFLEVVEEIKDQVRIEGNFNKKATNIHRLKESDIYQIKAK
jgi:three-Cys-motif partner protein